MPSLRNLASVVVCLLIAMAGIVSAGQSLTTGELTASNLEAAGQTEIAGQLLALYRLDQLEATAAPNVSFGLRAEHIQVVTYESDPALTIGATLIAPVQPGYQPATTSYDAAVVESQGAQTRSGYKFSVVATGAAPAIQASSACGSFAPSDRATFEAPWVVARPAQDVTVEVSTAVQWAECLVAEVTITGDFTMVLWEVDATLRAGDDTVDLRSGHDGSSVAPDPVSSTAQGTVSHVRQQYLHVQGGRLTFTLDSSPHFAYLQEPKLQTDGELRFREAAGELRQGSTLQPVQARSLALRGNINLDELRSLGQDQPLSVDLHGQVAAGEADGIPLAFTVAPGSPAISWGWIGLVGVGFVAVPVAFLVPRLRVRHQSHGHERAWDLTNRDNPEAASLVSAWASAEPTNPEALECLATLLARRGELLPAWQHRQRAEQILVEAPAMRWLRSENLLESAILAHRLSRQVVGQERDEWGLRALRCLNDAIRLEPDLRGEVDRHPDLHAITTELDDADDWLTP